MSASTRSYSNFNAVRAGQDENRARYDVQNHLRECEFWLAEAELDGDRVGSGRQGAVIRTSQVCDGQCAESGPAFALKQLRNFVVASLTF